MESSLPGLGIQYPAGHISCQWAKNTNLNIKHQQQPLLPEPLLSKAVGLWEELVLGVKKYFNKPREPHYLHFIYQHFIPRLWLILDSLPSPVLIPGHNGSDKHWGEWQNSQLLKSLQAAHDSAQMGFSEKLFSRELFQKEILEKNCHRCLHDSWIWVNVSFSLAWPAKHLWHPYMGWGGSFFPLNRNFELKAPWKMGIKMPKEHEIWDSAGSSLALNLQWKILWMKLYKCSDVHDISYSTKSSLNFKQKVKNWCFQSFNTIHRYFKIKGPECKQPLQFLPPLLDISLPLCTGWVGGDPQTLWDQ